MKKIWNKKILCVMITSLSCFLLFWCWKSNTNNISINEWWIELQYRWNIQLEKINLNDDDLDEIIWLYQETGDSKWYIDSLLIAEKYAKWVWINTFAQENLDTLTNQWLTLSSIKKSQIWIKMNDWKVNSVLVEYEITSGFVENIPLIYLSQLFVPKWENVLLYSYITEDKSARDKASSMFKNIK